MKDKILYSQVTKLAYELSEKFYGQQYVWCSDESEAGLLQPIGSDPLARCKAFLNEILSEDEHGFFIKENKISIERGALLQKDAGKITQSQEEEIRNAVLTAKLDDFTPILLAISYDKVKERLIDVPDKEKANPDSIEYKILDLKRDEYDIIDIIDIVDIQNIRQLIKRTRQIKKGGK